MKRNVKTMKRVGKTGVLAAVSLGSLLLAGCAANFGSVTGGLIDNTTTNGVTLVGKAYGGQQPVSGATIQLYAVGTSSYGSPATALITGTTVKTNINGGFTLPANSYQCPAGSYVYLTATGGDPGLGTGNNAALALLAALGPART